MKNQLKPEVYISYAWEKQEDGSNWPVLLKNLHEELINNGFIVHIDINSLKYRDNIKSFMQDLGKGKYIISIISEKYMESINCMYEVIQMLKYPNFKDRIFPIITSDAKIYDSSKILKYLIYWDGKISNLNNEIKLLSSISYAAPILEDIEIMNDIRRVLAQFGNDIGTMNVLTSETHNETNFEQLIKSIESKFEIDKSTIDLKIENLSLREENLDLKKELEVLKQKILNFQENQIEKERDELTIESVPLIEKIEIKNTLSHQIQDFENFMGFTRESYLDDTIKIFGKPVIKENEEKYSFNDAEFEKYLKVSYYKSSNKVMVLELQGKENNFQSVIEKLKTKGVTDSKIELLGVHKDVIVNLFGNPDMLHSDNYYYNADGFIVNFICYEFNKYLCTEITVQWINR